MYSQWRSQWVFMQLHWSQLANWINCPIFIVCVLFLLFYSFSGMSIFCFYLNLFFFFNRNWCLLWQIFRLFFLNKYFVFFFLNSTANILIEKKKLKHFSWDFLNVGKIKCWGKVMSHVSAYHINIFKTKKPFCSTRGNNYLYFEMHKYYETLRHASNNRNKCRRGN